MDAHAVIDSIHPKTAQTDVCAVFVPNNAHSGNARVMLHRYNQPRLLVVDAGSNTQCMLNTPPSLP
jgi:hypothetical protein